MNSTRKRITRKDIFENKITQENSVIEIINLNSKYYKVIKQVEIGNYYLLDTISTTTSCRWKTYGSRSNKIHSKKAVYPLIGVFNNKVIIMKIMKNRFKCDTCNKISLEPTLGVKYKNQIANCIKENVINYLLEKFTYSDSARPSFISPSTVIKIFDNYNIIYKRYTKVENILIDALRLISNKKKFQFVVIDANSKEIIDILEIRNQKEVIEYLLTNFSIGNLKTVTMDLWNPYKNAVIKFNKETNRKVQIIADKFHFVRQLMWDLDDFRIEEYEKVKEAYGTDDNDYKVIKHISKILRMRRAKLNIKGQSRLNEAFGISNRLYKHFNLRKVI